MKNTVLKFYITVVCLFSNLLIFALPGEETETNDLEIVDPSPIDNYIWILALIVLVYAFVKLSALQNNSRKM